jgi:malate dehydrogenase (oxaloacetate-decarboxylating)
MHDDQHGTAIVLLAALRGAAAVQDRAIDGLRVVISGAGAAGIACARILLAAGVSDVVVLDSRGVLDPTRGGEKAAVAAVTNPRGVTGGLEEAIEGADVFVGLSCAKVPEELLARMARDAIVFALSNPDPEVHPDVARRHAAIVATGRSDFPNQINNVLAFPGVFRGALDAGARRITEAMKLAAAEAIFSVARDDLSADAIVPSPFDPRVALSVSSAVAAAAQGPNETS